MTDKKLEMNVCTRTEDVRARRKAEPLASWGLVPTMGYLHEGHLSLVRRAREENDYVAVSIFVNPTQFAPHEDLAAYPRNLERDLGLLASEGANLIWTPTNEIMYPDGYQTYITVEEVTQQLEGAARPTHFRGVATVVAKLFNVVEPTRAYFGQKDAQQTIVLRRMARDLDFDVEIVVCPTVREHDGLAASSRNARLSPEQRSQAKVLFQGLSAARRAIEEGERSGSALRKLMAEEVGRSTLARLDYVSVAHPQTLAELTEVESEALLSLAVWFDDVRLIDNMPIRV